MTDIEEVAAKALWNGYTGLEVDNRFDFLTDESKQIWINRAMAVVRAVDEARKEK